MQRDRMYLLEMVAWWEIMKESQKAKVTGIDMVSFNNMGKVAERLKRGLNLHVEFQYDDVLKRLRKARGLDKPPKKKAAPPPVNPEVTGKTDGKGDDAIPPIAKEKKKIEGKDGA